jgi:myosin-1
VRRAGFCYRNFFEKFLKRYGILTPHTHPVSLHEVYWQQNWNGEPHEGVAYILQTVDMDPTQWQLGHTKIFIRSPESLFMLEEMRERVYDEYARKIQRAYRKWKSRKVFMDMRRMGTSPYSVIILTVQRQRWCWTRRSENDSHSTETFWAITLI